MLTRFHLPVINYQNDWMFRLKINQFSARNQHWNSGWCSLRSLRISSWSLNFSFCIIFSSVKMYVILIFWPYFLKCRAQVFLPVLSCVRVLLCAAAVSDWWELCSITHRSCCLKAWRAQQRTVSVADIGLKAFSHLPRLVHLKRTVVHLSIHFILRLLF